MAGFYAMRYRESIKDQAVLRELDDMIAHYNHQLSQIMNPDGELLSSAIAAGSSNPEDENHWWRRGPWTFDDPTQSENQLQAIIEQDLASGTSFNDFSPEGIEQAIGLEIGISGGADVTFTGIKRPNPVRRRLLILINQDSSRNIILSNDSSSSLVGNRFACPNGINVTIKPKSAVFLFYTLERNAWTVIGAGDNTTRNRTASIKVIIDGGGSVITTGVKCDVYIPVRCTITAATLLADVSGSIVIDIWADIRGNYPPTASDSITASAKPTLSSATNSRDTTLTGWSTTLNANDTLRINVDSVSTIKRVELDLQVTINE